MGIAPKTFIQILFWLLVTAGCSKLNMSVTKNFLSSGPHFRITDASTIEGSNLLFTVTLSEALTETSSVNYTTVDGSALAGTHFSSTMGTLTFLPGETIKTITVPTTSNPVEVCSANKALSMSLSNPVAASLSKSTGTGTIADTDLPNLSIADSSSTEGTTLSFTATLDTVCGKTISFSWATTSSTATSGADFNSVSRSETIPAGQNSFNISVPTVNDLIFEPSETFTVTISSAQATIGTASATGTITDNDSMPVVQFSSSSQTFSEAGGTATITVSLSNPSYQNITVPFTLSGSATDGAGNDYSISASPLIISAGSTTATLSVLVYNDSLTEVDETIVVTMGTPTNATKGARDVHTLTITDNDQAVITNVTSALPNATYTSGNIDIQVNFSSAVNVLGTPILNLNTVPGNFASYVSGSGSATLLFRYPVQASDESPDLDYRSTSALVLSGGTITDALKLTNVNLTLPTPGTAGSLGFSKNIIINAPDAPTISSFSIPSTGMYYLGDALNFTLAFDQVVTVSGTPILGLNIGGSLVSASYVSGSGTTNLTFRYSVQANIFGEAPLLVSPLNLNAGTIRNSDGFDAKLTFSSPSTTGVIVDGREIFLNFSTPNPTVSEASGTGRTVTVTLSAAPLTSLTVPLRFGGNASKGSDYELAASSITFAPGQTSVNVPYDVFQDPTLETGDHFYVIADRPLVKSNLLLGVDRGARVSILDDDAVTDRWKMIVPGGYHTCGITNSGVLKCWGLNDNGRLGDTTTTLRSAPVEIDNPEKYKFVDTGDAFTCGITNSDELKCWGWNGFGQLGDGSTTDRLAPVQITLEKYKIVSAGFQHSCGITINDELKCWGRNNYGQLGDGTTSSSLVPKLINSPIKYLTVSVSDAGTCAVTLSGEAQCWGQNWYGQIGDGTYNDSLTPVTVDVGTSYLSISASVYHTCGLTTGQTIRCWGENWDNQFGDGTDAGSLLPVDAAMGESFKYLLSSVSVTCGITLTDTLKCWGGLQDGIGDGAQSWHSTPIAIDAPVAYSTISVAFNAICGVTAQSIGKCWGTNFYGQLGRSSSLNNSLSAESNNVLAGIVFKTISNSAVTSCGITSGNSLLCWGQSYTGDGTDLSRSLPVTIDPGVSYDMVAVNNYNGCGITSLKVLKCWGYNSRGEVGAGDTTEKLHPTIVDGSESYKTVAIGYDGTCAITTSNVLKCWGNNSYGSLGTGSNTPELSPRIIDGGVGYSKISIGTYHACGVTMGNVAKCWGSNGFGRLGDGTTISRLNPTPVVGGLTFKDIVVGENHTCGITTTDLAYCWGRNSNGQLGDSTTTNRTAPQAVAGGGTFKKLLLGESSTCGITGTDSLRCWGANFDRQLGDGTVTQRTSPVASNSTYSFLDVSLGKNFGCGSTTTNKFVCWGDLPAHALGDDFLLYPFPVKDY